MNTEIIYTIWFNGSYYKLSSEKVDELLKISESKSSGMELSLKLKKNEIITGIVTDFNGFNPLDIDIYIPVSFKIMTTIGLKEFTFLDITSIEIIDKSIKNDATETTISS